MAISKFVFDEQMPQRVNRNLQNLGGARLIAARSPHRFGDEIAFEIVDVRRQM